MKIPIKKYAKNAFIYIGGKSAPTEFYIIKSGQVKICRNNPIIGEKEEIQGVGYIFGIIQCMTGIPDDVRVVTVTEAEIMIVTKDRIEELFVNHKKVIMKILSEYSEILRRLDTDLASHDILPSEINRKERALELVDKYNNLGDQAKAMHLLNSIIHEFPEDTEIINRAVSKFPDFEKVKISSKTESISEEMIEKDAVIFTEFENAKYFYIIKKGKIKITKLKHNKEILLAILSDGDVFGEMAVLNDKPRNASAVAVDISQLMVIDKSSIEQLPPPLFKKLLEFLSKRIWLVQQQIICHKIPVVTAKIYYLLASKIRQVIRNIDEEKGNTFIFKFPADELYQMLDYEFDKRNREEIAEFLDDSNLEFFWDSIKVKNIGKLFDKNSFHFSRAVITYNNTHKDI